MPPTRALRRIRAGSARVHRVLVASALLLPGLGAAQSIESDVTDESAQLVRDESHYAIPDLGEEVLQSADYHDARDRFSIKFGLALLAGDYTTFEQDAASYRQVGLQEDDFEARSLRLMVRGHWDLFRRWNYLFSYEYNGFDRDAREPYWSSTDVRISTDIDGFGTLSIGKIKEPFVYEMVGDAANLPQSERLMSPFFRSRNVGIQVSRAFADQRATFAVGVYNDWLFADEDFDEAGTDFAARVTALPVWEADGARYLHVAASVRYYDAEAGRLQFRGKPATNVSDYYVDTGKFDGDHSWNAGVELLWNVDGWSLLGEYVTASVSAPDFGNPDFHGWYVTGSWVVTGEHRPYDRKAAYARRILPQGRWGAWEIIGRYGRVDLNDGAVQAGAMDGWWAGVNWWATNRWKFGVAYGNIDLDRFDLTGNTQTFLARMQWIY